MRAKVHSKLAESEGGQRAATGEYDLVAFEISNDILHTLDVLGIFSVVGSIPLFDLACVTLACVKSLGIQPTEKLLINNIRPREWRETTGGKN